MALAEGIGAAMADMWLDGKLEFGDGARGRLEKSNAEPVESWVQALTSPGAYAGNVNVTIAP